MLPNQTLIGTNGKEVCLFPLTSMLMTQDENGSFSHQGSYAMDFAFSSQVRVPYYAPCKLKLVVVDNPNGNTRLWESVDEVNTPSGVQKVRIMFIHDDNPPYSAIGTIVNQGVLIGRTGTAPPATGDHVHIESGKGIYDGQYYLILNSYNVWMLRDSTHNYDIFYINDTTIYNDGGHDWKKYDGGTPQPPKKKVDDIIRLMNVKALYGYNY